jgi:hypothetical protein
MPRMIFAAATAALLLGAAAAAQAQQIPYSVCKYPKVCPPDTYPMPMPPKSSLPVQSVGVGHAPGAAVTHKRAG